MNQKDGESKQIFYTPWMDLDADGLMGGRVRCHGKRGSMSEEGKVEEMDWIGGGERLWISVGEALEGEILRKKKRNGNDLKE